MAKAKTVAKIVYITNKEYTITFFYWREMNFLAKSNF